MRWWPFKKKGMTSRDLLELILSGAGRGTKSGINVTVDTALQVSTVFCCTRVLGEDVGKIPLKLYREHKDGNGAELLTEDPRYRLVYRRPNAWQTSIEFRETLMWHAVLTGNGYAFKNVVKGKLKELLPWPPNRVNVLKNAVGDPIYELRDEKGTVIATVPRNRMFILRGPSWDSYQALEVIRIAREAIGLSAAAEESQAEFHANGTQSGGVMTTEMSLGEEKMQKIRDAFQRSYAGSKNAFKMILLDAGFKFTPTSMSGVDAQLIETRKFQVEEICRFLRVYPQKVMHTDKATTYASAEQFSIDYVIDCILPWVERWEQALARDLLEDGEEDLFFKFTVSAIMRGDAKSRAEYFKAALGNGNPDMAWMVRNEVRALEELNPIDGWDEPPPRVNEDNATNDGTGDDDGTAKAA